MNTFAAAMRYAIQDGFPRRAKKRSPTNEFVRLNFGCCTVSDLESKAVTFDYGNMLFSKGRLLAPTVSATYSDADHSLSFVVSSDTSNYPGCNADDVVVAVILDAEHEHAMTVELGTRGDGGTKSQALNALWSRENLHVYVYARNVAGDDVSTSTHLTIGQS